VRLTLTPDQPAKFTLRLRIPGWAQGRPVPTDLYGYDDATPGRWTVKIGGALVSGAVEKGYVAIAREWKAGDVVELDLPMPVRAVHSHPQAKALCELLAFERGPVVYCVEGQIGEAMPVDLTAPPVDRIKTVERKDLLDGVVVLTTGEPEPAYTAIPYFAWDNRGLAPMAVWLKRGSS
jgi:hypothetical protein